MNSRFMPQPWPSRPPASMRLAVTLRPEHSTGAGAAGSGTGSGSGSGSGFSITVFTASMTSVWVVSWSVHAKRPMLSAGP